MKTPTMILLGLTVAVALGACKKKTEPETVSPPPPAAEEDLSDKSDDDPGKAKIVIDPKIQELCGIDSAKSNFDFDSAALGAEGKSTLDALAACFLDGPAKDESMKHVGHTDPRGTEEYNLALGQRRVGSVTAYLEGQGLTDDRMQSSSRGELASTSCWPTSSLWRNSRVCRTASASCTARHEERCLSGIGER